MNGGIPFAVVSGKYKARDNGVTTETNIVPAKITLSSEFRDPEFNPDDILEYDMDRVVDSKDNKGWTKWWILKGVNSSASNGHVKRGYARTRNNGSDGKIQVEKVIFDMETTGFWVDDYSFIRNVLESLSSTSV